MACGSASHRRSSATGWRERSGAGNRRRDSGRGSHRRSESRRLAFTPGPLLWLTTVGDRAVLGLGDRVLDMPVEAHDFLSALLDAECPVDHRAV